MENSDQVISSSTTSNPSLFSKSDENDQNYPPSVANLDRGKLGEMEKVVKKKVLTERNEAMDPKFTENSSSEIPKVDPKPSSCQVDVFQTTLPYDPLTNYLSPRPRFLRYKPNKRREIFWRIVGEDSFSVSHTSSSEEEERKMKEEELEVESEGKSNEIDDEGEGDKEEENRGWTVKELLKFLLVVASLILSTLYITSMNSPSPSYEVSGAFRSGSFPILNLTSEFESNAVMESIFAEGSNFCDEEVTEAASMRNFEYVSQLNSQEDAEDRGFIEETEILNGEIGGDKTVRVEYTELVEEAREKPLAGGSITEEMAEGEKNGVELLNFEDTGDREKGKESEISNTTSCETSEEDETAEAPNVNGFDEDKLLSNILTEVDEKEEGGDLEMIESNTGESESFVLEADKITILEGIINNLFSFGEDLEKLKSELVELMHTETESVLKAVLGLTVSSVMLTCLVLSFQHKKKKDDTKVPAISVSVEALLQDPVAKAEKVVTKESPSIKATFDVHGSKNELIRNVDSFKTLSPSIHSSDERENFKEMYHVEAPTVQFLGEFVFGEINNSLKNESGLKNWMIEVEDSNFPGSIEEKPVSKNMNSGPEQALSEFSATTSSPSYGSFTTKKKIVKKEVRIILTCGRRW
ncbi:uncharacterized protein LOC120070117 isoform X2 [Benincasa hispida]|uniref:uncharacterized protein LOC120070117 isoform X2 n=1 Tax=Benincasa hispida TaxID=102211 RepID=UPI0019004A7A|nr:uncharacterized protein LOC120070117 isoform X2 [Benincasa hispida]